MTKFLNISTDNTLGGNSPSDQVVSSQKAIKDYVDTHGGGGAVTSVNGRTGAVTGLEETSNKVTSVSSASTDTQYPTAKCLYDIIQDFQWMG